MLQAVVDTIIQPFASVLFPWVDQELDSHHAFTVEYEMSKDRKLDFHIDESDVTMNLCLGRQFEEGNLYFGGIRCEDHTNTG